MLRSDAFGAFICVLLVLFAAMCVHAAVSRAVAVEGRYVRSALVARYGLTDLCLFTEARYTRNPAVADLNSAFQDHPVSLEHFPSGSLMGPPPHLARPAWAMAPAEGGL